MMHNDGEKQIGTNVIAIPKNAKLYSLFANLSIVSTLSIKFNEISGNTISIVTARKVRNGYEHEHTDCLSM